MAKKWLAMAGAIAYGAVVLGAPRATPRALSVSSIAEELRASKLSERSLVDAAIHAVAKAFPYHSVWHLWESPEQALRRGRGWSHQYNTILLLVLRELGFRAELVHAARVRGFRYPWFLRGHTWVRVEVAGYLRDICAASTKNSVEELGFTPLTSALPVFIKTRYGVGLALSIFVVATVWRSWLLGQPIPDWVYSPRR